MNEEETLTERECEEIARQVDMALRYVEVFQPSGFDVVWTMEEDIITLRIKRRPLTLADFITGRAVTFRGELGK